MFRQRITVEYMLIGYLTVNFKRWRLSLGEVRSSQLWVVDHMTAAYGIQSSHVELIRVKADVREFYCFTNVSILGIPKALRSRGW